MSIVGNKSIECRKGYIERGGRINNDYILERLSKSVVELKDRKE